MPSMQLALYCPMVVKDEWFKDKKRFEMYLCGLHKYTPLPKHSCLEHKLIAHDGNVINQE